MAPPARRSGAGWPLVALPAMPSRRTKTGRRAHAARRRVRRDRLRRELRRPGRRARAGRRAGARRPAGPGAAAGPLRDRRAADLRLRRADRLARRRSGSRARSARRSTRWSSTRRTRPRASALPWTFSTFDYPALCALLDEQNDAEFETATVDGPRRRRSDGRRVTVRTDRGEVSAPLVVDALGWRRVLGGERLPAARRAALARPGGASRRVERRSWRSGSTARSCPPATAGASPPPTRCGSASARSTRASTSRSRRSTSRERLDRDAGALPGQLDPAPPARRRRGRRLLRRRLGRATACR